MQDSFEVKSSTGVYQVLVGSGLLKKTIEDYPDAIFLIDSFLLETVGLPRDKVIEVLANEEAKSLERIPNLISRLRAMGANRSSHLVAIGGGVIQDIATFVSSIYMRGISWTYMPTTLLGMVDSCIGGKSSINVAGYKNLIGNFYPPEEIRVDAFFVRTLPDEQIVGGLFEAAKICFARGSDVFRTYLEYVSSPHISEAQVQEIALLSLGTKKWFIEVDEFDQKERLLLNFGHTFGHAIEAGTHFGVSHGIAVGIGMVVAIEFINIRYERALAESAHVERLLVHIRAMLDSLEGVMVPPSVLDVEQILEKFETDKKHQKNNYRIICPQKNGDLALVSEPKTVKVRDQLREAFQTTLSALGWNVIS